MIAQVVLQLSDEQLAELAGPVAELLAERGLLGAPAPAEDPWLDVDAAATYLCCKPKRIYDLRSQGRLEHCKDGSRLLFRRSWLDEHLERDTAAR